MDKIAQYIKLPVPMALTIYLGLILFFSAILLTATNFTNLVTDRIYDHVTVLDIDLGGLSEAEAKMKVESVLQERIKQQIPLFVLKHEGLQWPILASEIDYTINSQELAHLGYLIGREGHFFNRFFDFLGLRKNHLSLSKEGLYDETKLNQIVQNTVSPVIQLPQSARLIEKDGNVQVVPEIWGQTINLEQVLLLLKSQISNHWSSQIDLVVEKQKPVIVAQELDGIDSKIATYTTQFNPYDINRNENIRIAAQQVNGVLIRPNEIFSFNEIVGNRVASAGFKEAPAYIDGKLVPDWGGGVCQVSSTLYNAVLLADLSVVERTSHIQPPGYVPLGQDATVADGLIDFKFKNTSGNSIYIATHMVNQKVTVEIYGKTNPTKPEIEIIRSNSYYSPPSTVVERDPRLPQGKELLISHGKAGLTVSTYRIKRLHGQEIEREFLSTDQFPSEPRIVRIGSQVISDHLLKSTPKKEEYSSVPKKIENKKEKT